MLVGRLAVTRTRLADFNIYIYIYIYMFAQTGHRQGEVLFFLANMFTRAASGVAFLRLPWLQSSRAGYTIVSTTYVSNRDQQSMMFLFPFQVLFFVSSEYMTCRLLK